ncbi:hypothetical protein PAECIP111893_00205 [Paenibacillus plantiphilus]|uniref:Tryptophan-rich sensory protein n=1 Tax=Paenibacillus plantiphilus TaxID=2905650 RepID=A0ABN8FQ50_9BACL|nr:TspO/MBR family protein [Paenibacillus plantiphilus]CAH1190161.1 hypothetical protein PAECIP111893_00205 [Paenibacillus plantiphilus]
MRSPRSAYTLWNIVGVAAVIAVNMLAALLPLNGQTTGELSDKHPVLITPAGYAFSIWSVIYVLLIGFAIYQATRTGRRKGIAASIGPWFLISCLLNMGWIFLWHYEYVTSSGFIMIALLLTLLVIYRRVQKAGYILTFGERIFVQLPFSIYLGWISVATIVNLSIVLDNADWNGFGLSDTAWAVIMLAVATLLALTKGLLHRDLFYMLVFVWAFMAIMIKQENHQAIVITAWIGAILLTVGAGIVGINKFRQTRNIAKL